MADKKRILDVNGDGKVDLNDLDAASKKTGITSIDDLSFTTGPGNGQPGTTKLTPSIWVRVCLISS